MANKNAESYIIRGDFAAKGLYLTNNELGAPEGSFTRTDEMYTSIDKVLRHRPSLVQIGNTIEVPVGKDFSGTEYPVNFVFGANNTRITGDADARCFAHTGLDPGEITCRAVRDTGLYNADLLINILSGESISAPVSNTSTVKFDIRADHLFSGADLTGNTSGLKLSFNVFSGSNRMSIAITSDGLYIKTAAPTYTFATALANIDDGDFHTIQITWDATTYSMEYDGNELISSAAWTYRDTAFTTEWGQIRTEVQNLGAGDNLEAWISNIFLSERPFGSQFENAYISDIIEAAINLPESDPDNFPTAWLVSEKNLYCYAGGVLWSNAGEGTRWKAIADFYDTTDEYLLPYGRLVGFRDQLIITAYNKPIQASDPKSALFGVFGPNNDFEIVDTAPAMQFAVDFADRIWGAGDMDNPQRLYFCADRDPTDWTTVQDAGYLDIPSEFGDPITALYGGFLDFLAVYTETGTIVINGKTYDDFSKQIVSFEKGVYCHESLARVGDNLYCLGTHGISSLVPTETFGDLGITPRSWPIHNLLVDVDDNTSVLDTANVDLIQTLAVDSKGLYLVGLPSKTSNAIDQIYVLNTLTDTWYGPWNIDMTCFGIGTSGYQTKAAVLLGNDNGQVFYMSETGRDSSDGIVQTNSMDGRSVDPAHRAQYKKFVKLRIMHTGTCTNDVDIYMYGDGLHHTKTITGKANENVYPGRLGIIEVKPDIRARTFAFRFDQDDADDEYLWFELEYELIGYENN